ncbi:MAG TPA: peptide ABC transporter substrate-binding protein [Candidatus Rubrimentiphilum sp.]|nr:peptide ABC transporter substrate-binding protein [Candidatus Rubrimentiphilum sp.]
MKRVLAVIVCSAFVFAGCTKTTTTGGPAPTPMSSNGESQTTMGPVTTRSNRWTIPHTLRYTTASDISTLNPHFAQQLEVGLLSSLTMAWLVKWDHNNNPIPELATVVPTMQNGGVSKDGLTITYHLRKGVRWSDGAPFNADDVVFSTQVVQNPANNEVSRNGWDRITKVDEPDKYTVVFHLSKRYSPFIETFFSSAGANPCLLPKHLLAQYPNINQVPYNSLPVGIGPFKYQRWDRASRVVLVANPLYWRGSPKLKKIVYEIIPDRNTALTELQAHNLDMWYPVPGNYYGRATAIPGFTAVRIPAYAFNHLDFNLTRPKVSDPVVRRALRLALDRATIRAKIGHGLGYLQEEPASRNAPYFDPTIQMDSFSIAQANALLDKNGWVRGPDGIRSKNGVKLNNLEFATATGSPDTDEQIELMRIWWKQIGVSIVVKHYPAPLLFEPVEQGGIVYGGHWDMIVFAWYLDPIGDFSTIYACYSIPPKGQNDMHWCNQKANNAMLALYGHYDQASRNRDDATVMQQLVADIPTIVTTAREDVYVVNRDLHNFSPNSVSEFDDFMNVDI